jgi:RimJ/RimL family protein N-acetyltransferase
MKDNERLTFINNITDDLLDELWDNCFSGDANLKHMNAHVPYPVSQKVTLNHFLTNQNHYRVWLIKRRSELDIIGFVIHGDFFPGHPNSVGLNIGLNYTKNGYAKETLQSLIEYLRAIGNYETFGYCFENNLGSVRTMENCGFINLGKTDHRFNGNHTLKFQIQL